MLINKAAYVKHPGVSRQTISDRIACDEIVISDSK